METINNNRPILSKATLQRLPDYYFYLKEVVKRDVQYISSTTIAEALKLNSIQVRKDLSQVSQNPGKPRLGFEIDCLVRDLESYLGYNNVFDAVLIGVGQLGRTLLSYEGFNNYGLHIVAGFDINEDLVGLKIYDKNIFPLSKLEKIVNRLNINIGIITVPKESAQAVCDLLLMSGIKAIWNFAPTHLIIPDNIVMKNENLAASFANLSGKLLKTLNK